MHRGAPGRESCWLTSSRGALLPKSQKRSAASFGLQTARFLERIKADSRSALGVATTRFGPLSCCLRRFSHEIGAECPQALPSRLSRSLIPFAGCRSKPPILKPTEAPRSGCPAKANPMRFSTPPGVLQEPVGWDVPGGAGQIRARNGSRIQRVPRRHLAASDSPWE